MAASPSEEELVAAVLRLRLEQPWLQVQGELVSRSGAPPARAYSQEDDRFVQMGEEPDGPLCAAPY